jgi:F-type H+-transporting ATPase subunit delta
VLTKLLVLLAGRDRLVLLPDLLETYRARLLDHQNVVRAEVTTATPLAADRTKAIERSLAQATGRTIALTTRVAPEIIGGLVARVGTTVYDGSVTTQLEKMRQRLSIGS